MTPWRRSYLPKLLSTYQEPIATVDDKINQLLEGWFGEFNTPASKIVSDFNPRLEVKEDKQNYFVDVELPGIKPDDVELTFNNKVLSIKGVRKSESEETSEDKKTHYSERFYGSFMRTVPFAEEITQDKINADFKHGLLKITLPKKPSDTTAHKKISIKS